MERRYFLRLFSVGTVAAMGTRLVWREPELPVSVLFEDIPIDPVEVYRSIEFVSTPAPIAETYVQAFKARDEKLVASKSSNLKNYLHKMDRFENSHAEDVYLKQDRYSLLVSTFKRLDRVQNLVGHGNFNVISFDEMQKYGKRYRSVGAFQKSELDFLEELFTANVNRYGFFGEKVTKELTSVIPNKDRAKVAQTGHYLFKGPASDLYKKVQKDLGPSIILTSGIRSVVKQTHLFLAKTIQSKGNLSRASRSLAPPGHSFHGVGDFDVGKVGFGARNFTTDFAQTNEFRKLVDLGYVAMRYPRDNLLGVRYEPWHIKVS